MIVVTGAAGLIGSGVLAHLQGEKLIAVDDLGSGVKWRNLVGKRFEDLIAINDLFAFLEGKKVEAIIHLGACSSTTEMNSDYLLENNTRYTVRLAEWAKAHKTRFIYASSAATYGDGKLGFSAKDCVKLKPLNPYGFSKQLADLWMLERGLMNSVVALKYFNIFGPNENHKGHMSSMVFKMFDVARSGKPIRLFKSNDPAYRDGGQMRDFLYVKDAVKYTCNFLKNSEAGIFNVGSGKAITWNELAESLFAALHMPVNIEYIDMPEELSKQYQNYTCAASGVPFTPIKEAVRDYVQNYLIPDARW